METRTNERRMAKQLCVYGGVTLNFDQGDHEYRIEASCIKTIEDVEDVRQKLNLIEELIGRPEPTTALSVHTSISSTEQMITASSVDEFIKKLKAVTTDTSEDESVAIAGVVITTKVTSL